MRCNSFCNIRPNLGSIEALALFTNGLWNFLWKNDRFRSESFSLKSGLLQDIYPLVLCSALEKFGPSNEYDFNALEKTLKTQWENLWEKGAMRKVVLGVTA